MTIQVTGKNVGTSEALQTYATEKISAVLEKYIGPEIGGHVRVEKERGLFRTACSIRLRTGLLLEAQGDAGDAYASVDVAVEHLEKRLRRYKRRLKNHHQGSASAPPVPESQAPDYLVNLEDDEEIGGQSASAPVIVAESARTLKELAVAEAVLQLDLTDEPFLLFRNAAHGGVNVVYRRRDGNIGWIDPAPEALSGSPGDVTSGDGAGRAARAHR